jgi:uncharacterized protein YbbK (DUF523 family)
VKGNEQSEEAMTNALGWAERLRDHRSRKVVFLSHCLLNENTRYLGGAGRAGGVVEIVKPYLERGIGIVQLPCPEEQAWGGVVKRRLVAFYGTEASVRYRLRNMLLPLMLLYTRWVYRRLARQVATQVEDYLASGFTVLGIIGIDGSPSCGVHRTVDVKRALAAFGRLPLTATVPSVNAIVRESVTPGRGFFVALLQEELARRRLTVRFDAHDLVAELDGHTATTLEAQ